MTDEAVRCSAAEVAERRKVASTLDRWIARAATAASVEEVIASGS